MSFDCDNCRNYRNGDCAGLTRSRIGFAPVQYVDPDILRSAQEAHDQRMHRENKYGSRNVEKREYAVEQARAVLSQREQREEHELRRVRSEHSSPGAKRASLATALRAWRKQQAQSEGIPAYCVFPDSTLEAIVSANITDKASLLDVRGIGPKLYAKYADAIFKILSAYR